MRDDDTRKRGPAPTPDPAHATPDSVTAGGDRRRGEWPTSVRNAALRAKWAAEHARRTWAFAVIREHLSEQPTPASIRTAARLWARDILHAADELAQARREHHQ